MAPKKLAVLIPSTNFRVVNVDELVEAENAPNGSFLRYLVGNEGQTIVIEQGDLGKATKALKPELKTWRTRDFDSFDLTSTLVERFSSLSC